jgi:SseB protein N-terminal domain
MAAHGKRFTGRPAGDAGAADPAVAGALDAWQRGAGSEHAALLALSRARLLVPVVALLAPGGRPPVGPRPTGEDRPVTPLPGGTGTNRPPAGLPPAGPGTTPLSTPRQPGDSIPPVTPLAREGQAPPHQGAPHKESEMALPTLIGNDGRAAIIAFTGVETLARWRPDARPVATPAARVWQAAAAEGDAVVIDVAGPVPFVVEGARLAALAAGDQPPPAHLDPDVRAAIEAVAAAEPAIASVSLAPGGTQADLAVTLRLTDPAAAGVAQRAAQAISAALTSRLRQGIALSAR